MTARTLTMRDWEDKLDAARREATRLAADAEDMAALERTERQLGGEGRRKRK